jgi:hypothetical protein
MLKKIILYRTEKTAASIIKKIPWMLCRAIMAVYFKIHITPVL